MLNSEAIVTTVLKNLDPKRKPSFYKTSKFITFFYNME